MECGEIWGGHKRNSSAKGKDWRPKCQDHIANQEEVDKCTNRNTKFFHRKAAGRAKKNKITRLRTDDGRITKNKKEMGSMTMDFFQQLYTQDLIVCPQELLQLVEPQITDEMNQRLCNDYSEEEILNALFQIGPLKAPGADGFPTHFFQ
jgi:hypothetical protein